ncbi:hypothetical protein VPNG_04491 [Cytospora leucostoma]|uniref:Major facilitator superfamily (MFS) profile domain-containing protein n=1 Tax=Cytospora leucostoma TaxID=1230097 RepID=A0A423XC83_9PEZI|nr:hypothetical protein VPNG_04491 [Cytospora leucostoma]
MLSRSQDTDDNTKALGFHITSEPADGPDQGRPQDSIVYLHGVRFAIVAVMVGLALFLVTVETTVATTSLVAITADLGGFETASWIMTSYQLGYVAVIVIFAKLSDIFGRKPVFVLCTFIFVAFSAGCAGAQTMVQLVPIGALVLVLAVVGIPNGFPYHRQSDRRTSVTDQRTLSRVDIPGSILLMMSSLSFTACFQEAESRFAWGSAYVITLLIATVVLWALLLLWERHVTLSSKIREPVLPWRFFTNRAMIGVLLGFVLLGGPMSVMNFQLPQRFQLVNGLSSLDAGVRLLPFGAAFPVGSVGSANIASKLRVPGVYLVLVGAVLQVIGYALLSTLDGSTTIQPAIYGYQILCGVGSGISYQVLYLLVPFTSDKVDNAVGMGAANQFRTMGSAFGLAITTSIFNGYIRSRLADLGLTDFSTSLAPAQIAALPLDVQLTVRTLLSEGYNRQMLALAALAAAEVPAALLMWRRKQIVTI